MKIGWGSWIKCDLSVGYGTGIGWNFVARGSGSLEIGRFSAIGEHVTVITSNHEINAICLNFELQDVIFQRRFVGKQRDVVIGSDVWIGDRCIILAGVTIGDGAVIAAGSVVASDVIEYSIVGGNPARVIGYRLSSQIIKQIKHVGFLNKKLSEISKNRRTLRELQKKIFDENQID